MRRLLFAFLVSVCSVVSAHALSISRGPITCHFDPNVYTSIEIGNFSRVAKGTGAGSIIATKVDGSQVQLLLFGESRRVQTKLAVERVFRNYSNPKYGVRCDAAFQPGIKHWCNVSDLSGSCNFCTIKNGEEQCFFATGRVRIVPLVNPKHALQ